jgi:TetR/AcrR family transcriptional regulator
MTTTSAASTKLPPKPEDSRRAILRAAILEFAEQGEAGARTDAIARSAGVNKALLHYYFGTKKDLYGVVLEEVFTGVVEGFLRVLQGPGTPGQRLLHYFLTHFDHLAASGTSARLLGHEMMRARAGQPSRIPQIVKICFGPLHKVLTETLAEGMRSGELRALESGAVLLSLTGVNVFYFMSGPFFREISGRDPREPDMLARQRIALLDFASTVLFSDPEQGRQYAKRIQSGHGVHRVSSKGESA